MFRYSFKVVDGPDRGRIFSLEPGVTMIGRLSEATVYDPEGSRRWALHDRTVSRTHSELVWDATGDPVLTHLSTTNDTYVDQNRITEAPLKPGHCVQMGETQLVVCLEVDYGWGEGVCARDTGAGLRPVKREPRKEPAEIGVPGWASFKETSEQQSSGTWGGEFETMERSNTSKCASSTPGLFPLEE